MRHIQNFTSFSELNEGENISYSPVDSYRAVALGVSRVFNLLSYFYAIAKPDASADSWKATMKGIASKKDYDQKWESLIETADEIRSKIDEYAKKRRNDNVNLGRFFDVEVVSRPVPNALQKFKVASDILTKELKSDGIRERLLLIDKALPLEPFRLAESQINESAKKKRTPTEAEVLNLAGTLSTSITQALSLSRDIKEIYPESKSFVDGVIKQFIEPASKKIDDVLNTPAPDGSLKLSKSVRKSYEDKGWVLDTTRDKHLIDQYEDLIDLMDEVQMAKTRIRQTKDNVMKELAPRSNATEYIEAGNRILDSVEAQIQDKEKVEDLRRRANLMIPIAKDQPLPTQTGQIIKGPKITAEPQPNTTGGSGYVNPDELRKLLKRRVTN